MSVLHRLGWMLLGLLVLAGAVHAPLHADESHCGPMSLCAGAVVLTVALAAVVLLLVPERGGAFAPVQVELPRGRHREVPRGRGPPV